VRDSDVPLRRALGIAVGIGLSGELYFVAARLGWGVTSPMGLLWPLTAGLALLLLVALASRTGAGRGWRAWGLLLVAVGTAVAPLVLLPPVARDELVYHLAIPALYVHAERIVEISFSKYAYYPLLVQMFYTPLVAHQWLWATKVLHALFGIATAAILLADLRTRLPPRPALTAVALFLTTPTVVVLLTQAYVDLGLTCFTAVALVGLLRWAETGHRRDLVLAGLGAGCAASTKYNGFLVVGLIACMVPAVRPQRRSVRLANLAALALASALPVAPWLLKNWWETGNPVFPLLNDLLGGRPIPEVPPVSEFTRRHALYGESWVTVALTPLRVFVTGREGDPSRFDGVFNPLYLLVGALGLVRPATPRDRLLVGFAAAFLLAVFGLEHFKSRFALPALVPLTVLAAEQLARWEAAGRRRAILAAVGMGAAFAFNAVHFTQYWKAMDPLPYWRGRESRAALIGRFAPEQPIVDFANQHLPRRGLVYLAFLGSRGFYWQVRYTYDDNFLAPTLLAALRHSAAGHDVASALRALDIRYLAAHDRLLMRFLHDNASPAERARWEAFAGEHLALLHRHGPFSLYEIVPLR
jgi:hypothetical protein